MKRRATTTSSNNNNDKHKNVKSESSWKEETEGKVLHMTMGDLAMSVPRGHREPSDDDEDEVVRAN